MNKEIIFSPAYDKRDPDPKKNYGVHGVDIRWYLKGDLGAVQFVIYTNWQLPHVQAEFDAKSLDHRFPYMHHKPIAADIGYHSSKPMYEGQSKAMDKCDVIGGVPCYYDGSGLGAEPVFDILLRGGSEAVWKYLEEYYTKRFGELR